MTYADTAVTRPEFARELPRFVAEVRNIFSGEEIRHSLDHLERMAAIEDEQAADENHDDDFLEDSPIYLRPRKSYERPQIVIIGGMQRVDIGSP
jgi:hypothetical protein